MVRTIDTKRYFTLTKIKCLALIVGFLLIPLKNTFSQNNKQNNIEILKSIEGKYSVKIFIKEELINKLQLNKVEYRAKTVREYMSKLCERAGVEFFIFKNKYVFLTENKKLIDNTVIPSHTPIKKRKESNDIIRIGKKTSQQKRVTLKVNIKDEFSGVSIPRAEILINKGKQVSTSDSKGNFVIKVNSGYNTMDIHHIAFDKKNIKMMLYQNGEINIILSPKKNLLKEVEVTTKREREVKESTGINFVKLKSIEDLPSFMGETDFFKYSLLLPGIQNVGECDLGFNVRGGNGDQNLILIDGMHSYSHSHFFGFFPGISPDLTENATMYKSGVPVRFGNRLSSVYNLQTKLLSSNKAKFGGSVGMVNGSLFINTPVVKEKLLLYVGGRLTYSDWLLKKIENNDLRSDYAGFKDFNIKVSYSQSSKSKFTILGLTGSDNFKLKTGNSYYFRNDLITSNWKIRINEKLKINSLAGWTRYIASQENIETNEKAYKRELILADFKLQTQVEYIPISDITIRAGAELINHNITPWNREVLGERSNVIEKKLPSDIGNVLSSYIDASYEITPRFKVSGGIRFSKFIKKSNSLSYLYNGEKIVDNIIDSVSNSYKENNIDFNFGANLKLTQLQNINISLSRNSQYLHKLTNSQGNTPLDSWMLSNENIAPQQSAQYSIGYNANTITRKLEFIIEAYYKYFESINDFKNGSEFYLSTHPETEIVKSIANSYGIETLLKIKYPRLNGWLSYTYSRSQIKSKENSIEKIVNHGNWYSMSFDKPHSFSFVLNLIPSRRFSISSVINYSTGTPITVPLAKMTIDKVTIPYFSDRNKFRAPYYFRWDLSLTFKGSLKSNKKVRGQWVLGLYNITSRKNPYSIYYTNKDDLISGYKLSIFGRLIPTITYKFNF